MTESQPVDARRAAHEVAERVARDAYGRLVAVLAASTGDLALAEDALAGAFEAALLTWPRDGIPANPEGWLVAVGRNRQRDVWRSAAYRSSVPYDERTDASASASASGHGASRSASEIGRSAGHPLAVDPFADLDPFRIPDRRLELLALCAHPAIDAAVRAPLMLQVVLGFETRRIARAFAVPEATMAQRLVRAKRRIKLAGIPFELPDRRILADRLPALLEAVYGCVALTWRGEATTLAGEARHLSVQLAELLDREPEAWGLAAIASLSLARRQAGGYVPLAEQDPSQWDPALTDAGEAYLRRAAELGGPAGRFQLEAAMHAVHADRRRTGRIDWSALYTLASALVVVAPSLGARVALAAIIGQVRGAQAGLDALPDRAEADGFQPWWATRADLLLRLGRMDEARAACARAADLSDDAEVRRYLLDRVPG